MIQNPTQNQTANNFYSSPPDSQTAKAQPAKNGRIDAETKHRIYDRLLELLSNPQIKVKKSGARLPFILHPKTKDVLMSEDGLSHRQISEIDSRIVKDAEYFRDYETTRDAPAALYYALHRTGDTDLIFDNRIVPLPNFVLNALVCTELQKEFGRKILLACDGFIEVRATGANGMIYKAVRLDISGWIVRNGFMIPTFHNGLITALKIFRHQSDERPFRLKSHSTGDYQ